MHIVGCLSIFILGFEIELGLMDSVEINGFLRLVFKSSDDLIYCSLVLKLTVIVFLFSNWYCFILFSLKEGVDIIDIAKFN